jgi:hypothetical protein
VDEVWLPSNEIASGAIWLRNVPRSARTRRSWTECRIKTAAFYHAGRPWPFDRWLRDTDAGANHPHLGLPVSVGRDHLLPTRCAPNCFRTVKTCTPAIVSKDCISQADRREPVQRRSCDPEVADDFADCGGRRDASRLPLLEVFILKRVALRVEVATARFRPARDIAVFATIGGRTP